MSKRNQRMNQKFKPKCSISACRSPCTTRRQCMDLHTGDITRDNGRGADAHGDTIVDRTETTVTRTVDREEIDDFYIFTYNSCKNTDYEDQT